MQFLALIVLLLLPAAALASPASDPADTLLSRLDSNERDYHDQLFDYVMANGPAGKTYDWSSYAAAGSFRPGANAPHGNTICRNFHEKISLKDNKNTQAEADGVACKRVGSDGWCRLHKGDMRSCALEPPRNLLDRTAREGQNLLFRGSETWRQTKNSDWWSGWWPF